MKCINLNQTYYRTAELKQEAGKISNVELQRLVARIFYYLCVVTLQYVAPMILVLYLALMYKTMGGGTWTGMMALLKMTILILAFCTAKGWKTKRK